jgi:hypothetical protein
MYQEWERSGTHVGYWWESQMCRWVDSVEMNVGEIGWGGLDWIGLVQYKDQWRALLNTTIKVGGCIICCEVLE